MAEVNKAKIVTLFSTPVVVVNIGRSFTRDETECFHTIPMHKDEKGMSNHQSKDRYLFDTFVEELNDIINFCEQQLQYYLQNIEGVDTDLAGLRITQSWLNKTKPDESHNPHHHPNSYLSGVLYIKCLPNDHINFTQRPQGSYGAINFDFPKEKITVWNATGLIQDVIEGDLILFPSWVSHHVDVNTTKDKDRISLSFNTFPTGELGGYDNATHLKL